jgi:hypothetical protein
LFGPDVRRHTARLRRHQKQRLSLPLLPPFPTAPPIPQE